MTREIHWTNLRNCAYLEAFDFNKIVYPETMRFHKDEIENFPRFALDNGEYICDKTVFMITSENNEDILYLLAFLNSCLMRFLLPKYVSAWDESGFMVQKVFIERIPVPIIKESAKRKINSLVHLITAKSDFSVQEKIDKIFLENIGFDPNEEELLRSTHVV